MVAVVAPRERGLRRDVPAPAALELGLGHAAAPDHAAVAQVEGLVAAERARHAQAATVALAPVVAVVRD